MSFTRRNPVCSSHGAGGPDASRTSRVESTDEQLRRPVSLDAWQTGSSLQSPIDAVDRARKMLRVQRNLTEVSDSLFDTIEINEIGPATVLAYRMINNHASSFEAVRAAFERARADFASYDGTESPRTWALSYVAEEAVKRSTMQSSSPGSAGPRWSSAEAILQRLEPERRLAVILIDVLGLTDEAAARVSRTDVQTVRRQVRSARRELGGLWNSPGQNDSAA